jgi:propionyl-CoA carboxylase alpha chain
VESSTAGVTVRVDAGVIEGSEISVYYDPMIAKLVTHAATRERAIAAQADALDAFVIDGIRHNIPFLAALMQNKRWQAGKLSTGFIAEEFPRGFHPLAPEGKIGQTLAAVAAAVDHVLGERRRRISGQRPEAAVTRERRRVVRLGDTEFPLDINREDDGLAVRFGGEVRRIVVVSEWWPGELIWTGTVDHDPVSVQVRPVPNGFDLMHRGVEVRAYVFTEREAEVARLVPPRTVADGGKTVRCPMPGQVVSLAVSVGQDVKAGEALAVIEAMKMENVLRAERDGVIKAIHVRPGDSLAVDAVMLEFA